MAIQIRRGTNTEWESNNSNIVVGEPAIATDAERFFVGTASGDYAEFANLDIIAPAYNTSTSYVVGDIINYHGKLYSCNAPCSGAFNIGYWNETSLTEILKDLENEIDYAQYEIGYADGELITIDNGASEIPVKDLTLDIEAVQDLHGYSHPWVGGAGKNKIDVANTTTTGGSSYIFNFATLNLPAGVYTFSCTTTASNASLACEGASQTYINSSIQASGGKLVATFNATDVITKLRLYAPAGTYSNIQLEQSSSATSFEPYSNVCPISGRIEVDINVRGKNFLHDVVGHTNPTTVNGVTFTQNSDGSITMNGTTTASTLYYLSNRSATPNGHGIVLPKGTYTLSGIPTGYSSINLRLGYNRGADSSTLGNDTGSGFTFTESIGGTQYGVWIGVNSGATLNNVTVYPMIRLSTDSSTYEPYNGQTYTIDLNGTRYGGTLDVTTGVLTIDKYCYSFTGNETFVTNSAWGNYSFLYNTGVSIKSSYQNQTDSISSHLQVVTTGGAWASLTPNHFMIAGNTFIGLGYDGTQEQLKAWLSAENSNGTPVQVIGLLATPQVVQLTPTQVRTVLGTNNLWNSMNSNNELAYRISNALN